MTYKNTVCSSVSEIKKFVAEVIKEYNIDKNCFELDYSMLANDDLWYLKQISNRPLRKKLTQVASKADSISDSLQVFQKIKEHLMMNDC